MIRLIHIFKFILSYVLLIYLLILEIRIEMHAFERIQVNVLLRAPSLTC